MDTTKKRNYKSNQIKIMSPKLVLSALVAYCVFLLYMPSAYIFATWSYAHWHVGLHPFGCSEFAHVSVT